MEREGQEEDGEQQWHSAEDFGETRVGKVDIILRVGKDPLKQFIYLFI